VNSWLQDPYGELLLRLAVDYTAILPDGSKVACPGGTLLKMNAPGGRIAQGGGFATKASSELAACASAAEAAHHKTGRAT
jgi:hypothetical protein